MTNQDSKSRSIMASVALKAAIDWKNGNNNMDNISSDEDILRVADDFFVWLRVKEEVGLPAEVKKEIEKVKPF